MSVSLSKIGKVLIYITLLSTPIYNIFEIISINELRFTQSSIETPVYIKLIKDTFFLILIFIAGILIVKKSRLKLNYIILLMILFVLFSAIFTLLTTQNESLIIAGLRWAIPFIMILFLLNTRIVDDGLQCRIAKIFIFLFLIAFILQLYQFLFLSSHWGIYFYGFNLRNPGFFSIPQTMAFFTIVTMYYSFVFIESIYLRYLILFFFGPISILLTASGTGIIAILLFYFLLLRKRIKQKTFINSSIFLVLCFAISFLPLISGREDILYSFYYRLLIFKRLIIELTEKPWHILISTDFGAGTNSAVLFGSSLGTDFGFIADSMFNSLIANTGFFSLIIFLIFILKLMNYTNNALIIFSMYFLFSINIIIFESFPMNLLFAINTVYYLNMQRNIKFQKRLSLYEHRL